MLNRISMSRVRDGAVVQLHMDKYGHRNDDVAVVSVLASRCYVLLPRKCLRRVVNQHIIWGTMIVCGSLLIFLCEEIPDTPLDTDRYLRYISKRSSPYSNIHQKGKQCSALDIVNTNAPMGGG